MITTLSILFVTTLSQPIPDKKPPFACEGRYECFKSTFSVGGDKDKMLCDGYRACYRATYESTVKNKALCNGYQGCEGVLFNAQPEVINCRGFESCINIGGDKANENFKEGVSASDSIDCSGVKACNAIDGGINAPRLICDGDKACFKTKLTSNFGYSSRILCNGKKVCAESSQIRTEGQVYCDGDGACEKSRIQAKESINCHGKRGCKGANLQYSKELQAYGMMGAGETTINGINRVIGYGFMSLAYSCISSVKTDDQTLNSGTGLTVSGFGYKALKGASIFCANGIPCVINCMGNACKGLTIYYQPSAQLKVYPEQCLRAVYKKPDDPTSPLDRYEIVGKFADPAVKCTYCPSDIKQETPPCLTTTTNDMVYDEEYKAGLREEIEADKQLEKNIDELRDEIESTLFLDEQEKIDEENEYLVGTMHGSFGLKTAASGGSLVNGMVIGWISLAVVVFIGVAYLCYARKYGEYKALSSDF